jgi:serine/threonine protein kinase/Flp pilus assembly protein TadD
MMPPESSLEPSRTVRQEHKPLPDTVDLVRPGQTTTPDARTVPDDVPAIPGYRITAEIARGGMGRVYAGYDLTLDREVAIKTLLPGANAERFVTEAKITAKLPHPGIPPVHAMGTLDDGTPWLAMKLIHGRTLHDLLKQYYPHPNPLPRGAGVAGPSPSGRQAGGEGSIAAERGRYIQIFEQIAQAVGFFAHSRGIIHRDLKPLNVMVGEFGEVQVMDWGLAKVLTPSRDRQGAALPAVEDAGDPRPEAAGFPSVEPQRDWGDALATDERTTETLPPVGGVPEQADCGTRPGSVLGTPAYMPPEQARGDIHNLDTRSDVFGLGAILCQILTGRPPYRGPDASTVRWKAAQWEVGEAFADLDSCGAEPELVALCKRCLAREQADRPADGRTVAAEVARIRQAAEERARRAELEHQGALVREAEQRKRRRQAIVAGGIIVAVLLAGLLLSLWQMLRAMSAEYQVRQERDAKDAALKAEKAARQRTLEALRSLTEDVVERKLAQGQGHTLTDEDRAFLRSVQQQWEAFAAITGDDAESRSIRAEGLHRVGLMRYRLGDLPEAEAAYRDALALQKQLADEFPTRSDYRQELATSHNNLGVLLCTTGRLAEAEAAWRDALALQKQLADEFPTRPDYRQELARSHANLGILLRETGRLAEAEAAYRDALVLQKQLAAEFPTRPDFRQELASSHTNLGNLLLATGRLAEAETAYRDALALQKQLADEFPTRPEFRQELAASHTNLGVLLRTTGRLAEAETAYHDALVLKKQLAADFPTRPDFRQELALSHNNLGVLLSATGRLAEAEAAYRDALAIRKQLADHFPNQPDMRNELASTLVNLAILAIQRRDFAATKAYLAEAQPHHQAALKANPRHPTYRQFYRNNLGVLAQAEAGLLDRAAAVKVAERIRDLGWDAAGNAYDAACALALCIPIVQKHEKLDAEGRQAAVQFYGDEAMKLLRDAVSKGFQDAARIKKETDLAPLRGRDDFHELLAALEARSEQPPAKNP